MTSLAGFGSLIPIDALQDGKDACCEYKEPYSVATGPDVSFLRQ